MRNGGIGTHNWLLAHLLASQGWYVHVLYCGSLRSRKEMEGVAERVAKAGIGWSYYEDFDGPETREVPDVFDSLNLELSDRVRYALEELHAQHRFDLAEFGDWGGLGFRSVQARRTGVAFADLPILVRLHSSSQWMREGNRQWPAGIREPEIDYLERYAFEHADFQVSPSRYMLDYARRIGWAVRPDARVIPYAYPAAEFQPAQGDAGSEGPLELVFFGRLETRKGLEVFIQAVRQLEPRPPVTFLGRVNELSSGASALTYIKTEMSGRPITLLLDHNREEALHYLAEGNRLAVMPSLLDNSPFVVIECLSNGLPFVTSNVGGVPELVTDPEASERLLFDPTPRDLLRCLRAYLSTPSAANRALHERCRQLADVERHNALVAVDYGSLVQESGVRSQESGVSKDPSSLTPDSCLLSPDSCPLVTIGMAHYNLGGYLPQALASLAEQTYRNLEVIVIDDGSTDPLSQKVFAQQEARYPQFRFLRQENAGIGATRNRALAEAHGEFFLTVDADNVARPDMIERFVAALQRNPDLSAVSCYYLAFRNDDELRRGVHSYAYRPAGGPHILACCRNVYGDANALFRTAALRSVGGYETDRDTSWEDLEVFVKLVHAGHRVDVLPDYLFYYRHLDSGWSRVTSGYLNQQRVLRQLIRQEVLPEADRLALWNLTAGLIRQNEHLLKVLHSLRYRLADRAHNLFSWSPRLKKSVRWLLRSGGRVLSKLRVLG